VGFMIPRKGFTGLFYALKDLEVPFKLIVIGEHDFSRNHFLSGFADSAKEIKKLGEKLLGKKLELTGPVKDIQKYYQAADVVLFNSVVEGLPNTLLEAMSCGIPIITRNIPGLEGFILKRNENCMIFKDENEMNDQIRCLYVNRNLGRYLGLAAIDYIRENADFQVILSSYSKRLIKVDIEYEKEN
jgi:glycosyltransferase involved in cell wall biosynthesis